MIEFNRLFGGMLSERELNSVLNDATRLGET